jgi:hypothetical protein
MVMRGPIVAALMTIAGAASAGDTNDAARLLLDAGVAKSNARDYEAARILFEHARELAPDKPNPIRWLGLTDARLGRCTDAIAELDQFLSMVPGSDPRVREATLARDLCKRQIETARPPEPAPSPIAAAAPSVATPPPSVATPPPSVATPPPSVEPTTAVAAPAVSTAPPTLRKKRPYWTIGVAVGGAVVIAGAIVLGVVLGNPPGTPPTATFGRIPLQ